MYKETFNLKHKDAKEPKQMERHTTFTDKEI